MIELKTQNISIDKSVKILWESDKKQLFESVLVPFHAKEIYAACISSQSGCSCECKICETSKYNYSEEIINLSAEDLIEEALKTKQIGEKIYSPLTFDEFAFMGMGEPLLNLKNVLAASKYLLDSGYHVAISTIGFPEKIEEISNYPFTTYPRLQLSLHGFENRQKIIPLESKFPIEKSYFKALEYAKKTNTPLSLNWVLLEDINNSESEATYVGRFLDPEICRLNITTYAGEKYKKTTPQEKEIFIKAIIKSSIEHHGKPLRVYSFETLGDDINAACGQLVGKYSK